MLECDSTDAGAGAVTNAEYEQRLLNKKRQIKVLDPKYLNIFLQEFKHLIKQ